jgi:hypothetical protein
MLAIRLRDLGRTASGAEYANGCGNRLPNLRRGGSVGMLQCRCEQGVSLGGFDGEVGSS